MRYSERIFTKRLLAIASVSVALHDPKGRRIKVAKFKVKCLEGHEFYMEDYDEGRARSAGGSLLDRKRVEVM